MSNQENAIDESGINTVAKAADLPLGEGRAAVIAPPLASWLADANELNRKMSQAKYLDLMPATVFSHQLG
jgi:hypothetical protein